MVFDFGFCKSQAPLNPGLRWGSGIWFLVLIFERSKLHSTLDSVGDLGFGFWFWLFFGGQTERGGVGIRDLGLGLGIGDWAESFQPKPSQVRGTGDVALGVVTHGW